MILSSSKSHKKGSLDQGGAAEMVGLLGLVYNKMVQSIPIHYKLSVPSSLWKKSGRGERPAKNMVFYTFTMETNYIESTFMTPKSLADFS